MKKKRILALFLAAVSCLSLAVSASAAGTTTRKATDFKDYDRTAWYAEAVSAAVDNGLLYGKSSTIIDPNGDMTRAEMAAIINRSFGCYKVADISQYKDVAKSKWYYWCSGSGSYHALIPAAAEAWGLPVSGCTASEPQRITDALSSGKLVVAIMSAGHFTSSGHFIVLRGVQDEKILVADPASRTRSEQSWELSIILNEASKAAGSGGLFWIVG